MKNEIITVKTNAANLLATTVIKGPSLLSFLFSLCLPFLFVTVSLEAILPGGEGLLRRQPIILIAAFSPICECTPHSKAAQPTQEFVLKSLQKAGIPFVILII